LATKVAEIDGCQDSDERSEFGVVTTSETSVFHFCPAITNKVESECREETPTSISTIVGGFPERRPIVFFGQASISTELGLQQQR
jgi:hypothetical protein